MRSLGAQKWLLHAVDRWLQRGGRFRLVLLPFEFTADVSNQFL